jgi:hypothetical protein
MLMMGDKSGKRKAESGNACGLAPIKSPPEDAAFFLKPPHCSISGNPSLRRKAQIPIPRSGGVSQRKGICHVAFG